MHLIEQLGTALGLASLAGINLYLTVFLVGLALRFHWIDLSSTYPDLMILADPWVFGIAGGLMAIEFVADKVAWVDTAWDSIHTLIRPVGGTLLAFGALGEQNPALATALSLLCGGASLSTHLGKASSRLLSNLNPEPTSNASSSIVMSFLEDLTVVGGLILLVLSPILAAFLALLLVAAGISMFIFLLRWWKKRQARKSQSPQVFQQAH